jgi:hypothetical protein
VPKIPAGLRANAEGYISLTKDTVGSLGFLLENIGETLAVDLSPGSIAPINAILGQIRLLPNPDLLFPEVVETLAQLLAQYGALVLLHAVPATWDVESMPSSRNFGQPYVDAVPGEAWQRYYPIEWQVLLRKDFSEVSQLVPLERQIASRISARQEYEALKVEILAILETSATGALFEAEILAILVEKGLAPDPRYFAVVARRFPERVGRVLRADAAFSRARKEAGWRLNVGRTRGRKAMAALGAASHGST